MKGDRNAIVKGEYCAAPHAAQELHGCDLEFVLSVEDLKRLNGHLQATSQSALSLMNDALPADDRYTIESPLPSQKVKEVTDLKGISIFLVDDDVFVSRTLNRILLRAEGMVTQAFDGREAIEKCGELPYGAVVLLDDLMPNMRGIDAAPIIKKKRPDLQIILFSGTAGSEDVQPLMESGVIVDSLNKTIGKEELIRNISLVARSCA